MHGCTIQINISIHMLRMPMPTIRVITHGNYAKRQLDTLPPTQSSLLIQLRTFLSGSKHLKILAGFFVPQPPFSKLF